MFLYDRTMALGSTHPLVKMSTRNISGGKGGRCVRLTTSPPSCAECHEIWEPKPLGTLWATPVLLRDTFTFTFLLKTLHTHTHTHKSNLHPVLTIQNIIWECFVQKIRIYASSMAYNYMYWWLPCHNIMGCIFVCYGSVKVWAVLLFISYQHELYCHYL